MVAGDALDAETFTMSSSHPPAAAAIASRFRLVHDAER